MDAPHLEKTENRQYYKLHPAFSTGRDYIYVPLDASVSLRPIVSGPQAARHLASLAQLRPKAACTQKKAELTEHYQQLLSTGQPENLLLLLKEIWEKEKRLAGSKQKLCQADLKYRKQAEKVVCEEFAVALQTEPEAIKARLYQSMECGADGVSS